MFRRQTPGHETTGSDPTLPVPVNPPSPALTKGGGHREPSLRQKFSEKSVERTKDNQRTDVKYYRSGYRYTTRTTPAQPVGGRFYSRHLDAGETFGSVVNSVTEERRRRKRRRPREEKRKERGRRGKKEEKEREGKEEYEVKGGEEGERERREGKEG